jgi:hypothetical protein
MMAQKRKLAASYEGCFVLAVSCQHGRQWEGCTAADSWRVEG